MKRLTLHLLLTIGTTTNLNNSVVVGYGSGLRNPPRHLLEQQQWKRQNFYGVCLVVAVTTAYLPREAKIKKEYKASTALSTKRNEPQVSSILMGLMYTLLSVHLKSRQIVRAITHMN